MTYNSKRVGLERKERDTKRKKERKKVRKKEKGLANNQNRTQLKGREFESRLIQYTI